MRKITFIPLFLFLTLSLQGCWTWKIEDNRESAYEPVVMNRTDFEQAVKMKVQENTIKAGKIYIKDNLLFIADVNRGFHIYNYSNPANPPKIGFLNIPGATDVAIRDNILYINQAVDLVAIEYDPIQNRIQVTNRTRNVFPQKISPDGFTYENSSADKIVTDWKE
ncbi:hypothetical protein [Flavobacterium sp.]|uniref:hypothetical protein n=1 Tax=Flavobacterium sp. TaxID=239 RepID=UPI00260F9821|nr:hypothetical protein [Flavobacterium sp.]